MDSRQTLGVFDSQQNGTPQTISVPEIQEHRFEQHAAPEPVASLTEPHQPSNQHIAVQAFMHDPTVPQNQ